MAFFLQDIDTSDIEVKYKGNKDWSYIVTQGSNHMKQFKEELKKMNIKKANVLDMILSYDEISSHMLFVYQIEIE